MTTVKNQRWEINVKVTEALQLRGCQCDNVCEKNPKYVLQRLEMDVIDLILS